MSTSWKATYARKMAFFYNIGILLVRPSRKSSPAAAPAPSRGVPAAIAKHQRVDLAAAEPRPA